MDLNFTDPEKDNAHIEVKAEQDNMESREDFDSEYRAQQERMDQEAMGMLGMLDHLAENWNSDNFQFGTLHYPTWEEILRESMRRITCRRERLPVPPPRTYRAHLEIRRLQNFLKIAIAIALLEALIIILNQF
ncbi:MAG: hypothetical protein FJ333_05725 [Sphingomonadales bacterium]|nr:hypothetical protein [Sphingomonadales bacterium]